MEVLGGQNLSGIGFGLGIDRVILAMEAEGAIPENLRYIDLYVVPLGAAAKTKAFEIVNELRNAGFVVEQSFGDRALKGAMKAADKSGARFSFVLGEAEIASGAVELKEMATGESSSVTLSALAATLAEKAKVKSQERL
jgi:histidyl-tRNA synthetase